MLAPAPIGQESTDIAACWAGLTRATYQYGPEGIVSTAVAGIDLALWDLAGRRAGRPAAELLGPRAHDRIPAYASLHWLGDVDLACADAARGFAAGFAGVKLHETDVAIITAVREAVGDAVPLMVDCSKAEAVRQAARLKGLNLTWIEVPFLPEDQNFPGPRRLLTMIDGCVLFPDVEGLGWS